MDEYQHTVSTRGRYRMVALTCGAQYDPAEVSAYTIVTDSGARVTPDLSLDDARVWLDSLVESDDGGRPVRRPDPVDLRSVKRR